MIFVYEFNCFKVKTDLAISIEFEKFCSNVAISPTQALNSSISTVDRLVQKQFLTECDKTLESFFASAKSFLCVKKSTYLWGHFPKAIAKKHLLL